MIGIGVDGISKVTLEQMQQFTADMDLTKYQQFPVWVSRRKSADEPSSTLQDLDRVPQQTEDSLDAWIRNKIGWAFALRIIDAVVPRFGQWSRLRSFRVLLST